MASCEEILPKPPPLRDVLTPRVLTVAASNGTFFLFGIAIHSILAIFYATSIELGGLSFDPPRIGTILATSAFVGNAFHVFFYSRLHDHFGAYAILMTDLGSGIPVVILFPVINALARAYGRGWPVWLAISIQHMLIAVLDLSYASISLFIRASAPYIASIGATNGVIQLVGGGARIIGPACAGAVFSYSIHDGRDAWLAYYFISMGLLAIGTSWFLPRNPRLWEEV
ncbi:hypothetical protein BDR04DRAFT_341255 [Suillus decipiens]|nr:hypothetical protein BDR04DRAFT_341255 [Suillus decipiens]